MTQESITFLELPDDMLLTTLSFLSGREIAATASVSQKFLQMTKQQRLWKQRLETEFNCQLGADEDAMLVYKECFLEQQKMIAYFSVVRACQERTIKEDELIPYEISFGNFTMVYKGAEINYGRLKSGVHNKAHLLFEQIKSIFQHYTKKQNEQSIQETIAVLLTRKNSIDSFGEKQFYTFLNGLCMLNAHRLLEIILKANPKANKEFLLYQAAAQLNIDICKMLINRCNVSTKTYISATKQPFPKFLGEIVIMRFLESANTAEEINHWKKELSEINFAKEVKKIDVIAARYEHKLQEQQLRVKGP